MMHLGGFLGSTMWTYQNEKFMVAFFDTNDDLQRALNLDCHYKEYHKNVTHTPADQIPANNASSSTNTSSTTSSNNQQNYTKHPFKFVNYDSIKQPKTNEEIDDDKERTIQVLDIPLGIATSSVHEKFLTYGAITKLTMRTKDAFQQAFITYETKSAIFRFYDESWSVFIMK